MIPLRRIVVATDFSEGAEKATREAIELAKEYDARVELVHAWVLPLVSTPEMVSPVSTGLIDELEKEARRTMDAALLRHRTPGIAVEGTVVCSDPREAVVETAEKLKADLIVIGTHGRRGLKRALLGSVAEAVVRTAPCAVLVVR
jgi:nucleotide-binding universal stress UspA family protein